MYCLRKKMSFFVLVLGKLVVSIIFHPKKKKQKWDLSISCCMPTAFALTKTKEFTVTFWFHKFIQSHMCYTGQEQVHCNFHFFLFIFNCWLQEKTGDLNNVIRIPSCIFSVRLLSCFVSYFEFHP